MSRQAVLDALGELDETAWDVVLENSRAILDAYCLVSGSPDARDAIAVIDAALEQGSE